jgi:ferric-dicitrate binding protein FerR (iron transport regulator)
MSFGANRLRPASAGKRWTVKKRNDQLDRLDPLTGDALAWIVRLKSGEATLADAEQLMDWRATSPAHESAYRGAVKCWQAIGRTLGSPLPLPDHRPRRKSETTSRS